MRVFILCTGRCGSMTFHKACTHITNYSTGHESRTSFFGYDRLAYPSHHIEVDNRLSWHLGLLDERFGGEPFYVHLERNRDDVAHSFYKRYFRPHSIIDAFAAGVRMLPPKRLTQEQRLQLCYDYVDTVTANIQLFLKDKPKYLCLNITNIEKDFRPFWERIGAAGDFERAMSEFKLLYNADS